jgi:hypothetical protein
MTSKDQTEQVDVVLVAQLYGRGCVLPAVVVPREDLVQLAVGDFATANDWLRRHRKDANIPFYLGNVDETGRKYVWAGIPSGAQSDARRSRDCAAVGVGSSLNLD